MQSEVFAPEKVEKKSKRHFKLPIRAVAFLFALIIASSTCILGFVQSVSALVFDDWDREFPIGFYVDSFPVLLDGLSRQNFSCTGFVNLSGDPVNHPLFDISIGTVGSDIVLSYRSDLGSDPVILGMNGVLYYTQIYFYFESVEVPSYDMALFGDYLSSFGHFVSFSGDYQFKEQISGGFLVNLDISFPFVSNLQSFRNMYPFGGLTYYPPTGNGFNVYSAQSGWVDDDYRLLTFDRAVPYSLHMYNFFVDNENPPPSPLDRLGSGLTSVITWFGSVIAALTTGSLAPVFWFIAVTVGVSLLGFGFVWLRRFIFGW